MLNKGEHAHKLSRAIAFGHHQGFPQGETVEPEIAAGCRRSVKNAVIRWNYLHLAQRIIGEGMDQ
jgi:TnpA family transposase